MQFVMGMLSVLVLLLVINFILVFSNKTETRLYQRYDKLSTLFVKLFSLVLLFTMVWIIVAAMYSIFVR